MASSLPVDDCTDKAVKDFGLGTYDGQSDNSGSHGEDSNNSGPKGKALPDDGGPMDPFGPDRLLSYPTNQITSSSYRSWLLQKLAQIIEDPNTSIDWHPFGKNLSLIKIGSELKGKIGLSRLSAVIELSKIALAEMPGDHDVTNNHQPKDAETLESLVHSISQDSALPTGLEPSARSDYYDHSKIGQFRNNDFWADEDAGVYAQEKSLPDVTKNDVQMDNTLGALGNAWSGFEVEDVSGVQGFPSTDRVENVDFPSSDRMNGGRVLAAEFVQKAWESKMDKAMKLTDDEEKRKTIDSLYEEFPKGSKRKNASMRSHESMNKIFESYCEGKISLGDALNSTGFGVPRVATDIERVGSLTDELIKRFGKKDLTKRHVLSFLQALSEPQFLSSDIIRCLKLRHSVHVKDVLDEFPVAKQASSNSVNSIRNSIIALEVKHMHEPEVAFALRRCSASLSHVIAKLGEFDE